MLTIRLTRKGKKNQPFFRVVVIDKRRSSKGGRSVEELGYVNPLTKKNSINKERALYWLKVGAQASPRVHNLLIAEKVIEAPKVKIFSITKKAKAEAAKAAADSAAKAAAPTTAPAPAGEASAAPEVPAEVPVEKAIPAAAESSGEAKEAPKEEPKA